MEDIRGRIEETRSLITEAQGEVISEANDLFSSARRDWEGAMVGPFTRVRWSMHDIVIEEIPQTPLRKRRVGRGRVDLHYPSVVLRLSEMLPMNIVQGARLTKSMTYDQVMNALAKSIELAKKTAVERYPKVKEGDVEVPIRDSEVNYLEVEPVDHRPVEARGKDFTVKTTWGDFEAYSPGSDLAAHDPYYTKISAKSKGAARKLYKMLKADPSQIGNVTWEKFAGWLKSKKIGFDYHHSVWH